MTAPLSSSPARLCPLSPGLYLSNLKHRVRSEEQRVTLTLARNSYGCQLRTKVLKVQKVQKFQKEASSTLADALWFAATAPHWAGVVLRTRSRKNTIKLSFIFSLFCLVWNMSVFPGRPGWHWRIWSEKCGSSFCLFFLGETVSTQTGQRMVVLLEFTSRS